jgi:dihydrofolate reductase
MDGEFADKMNSMPKNVVSSTLAELGWNSSLLAGDVATEVANLKKSDGGPILVEGSATLVQTLLAHGLIDELRLMVFPVILGGGLTIFPLERQKVALELVELSRYSSGVLLQIYRPV